MKTIGISAILEFLVPGMLLIFAVIDKPRWSVEAAAINYGDDSPDGKATAGASTEGLMKTTSANEKSSENREIATNPIHTTYESTVGSTTASSDVKQFFQTVQCTLEKAKPWVEEIEKEAKRLEESAKRFGEGVINKFSHFMEKLIPHGEHQSSHTDTIITNTKNNNNNNTKKQSINPVQSLLNTIIDGFGAVVSVVGNGVVGVATSMKPQPVHVGDVEDSADVIEVVEGIGTAGAGSGHVNRVPDSYHTKTTSVDADNDTETVTTTSTSPPATVDSTPSTPDAVAVAVDTIEHANELENQIVDTADSEKCPFGFVVDASGLCQLVHK